MTGDWICGASCGERPGLAMARPDPAMAAASPVGFLACEFSDGLLQPFLFFPLVLTMEMESESFPPGTSKFGLSVCVRLGGSMDMGWLKFLIGLGDSEMGDMPLIIFTSSSLPEDEVGEAARSRLPLPVGVVA